MKTMIYKTLALSALFTFLAGVAIAGNGEKTPHKRGVDKQGKVVERVPCSEKLEVVQQNKVNKRIATEKLPKHQKLEIKQVR